MEQQPSFLHNNKNNNNNGSIFHSTSHLIAIIFCYLVGTFGLNVLFITPVFGLLWYYWNERWRVFEWTTQLMTERKLQRQCVIKSGETVNWINQIIDKWWTCCDGTVTNFVKDWIEPIVNKFKFPSVISESIKILSFNTGPHHIKFYNLRLMQPVRDNKKSTNNLNVFVPMTMEKLENAPVAMAAEGRVVVALEADVSLEVPNAEFKMKAGVGLGSVKQNFALNIESFHVSGRVRCVINADKTAPFPHVATADVCFVSPPTITVQVRILKDFLEVSNKPGLKQIMEKFIAFGFQRLLVYPGTQHIDFTPTPLPGPEWVGLRGRGLSQGVLTVRVECVNGEGQKKNMMSSHYCKLRLGTQKCIRECTDGSITSWSSTFSFLIHDTNKEKLHVKLKNKKKLRRDMSVAKQVIDLQSLGIIKHEYNEETTVEKSQIQMSSQDGFIHLCLSLFYTPLPQFSLLKHTPALNNCDTSEAGVLYIHVHGARNLFRQDSSKYTCNPYCVVTQGARVIFKTNWIYSTFNPVWESGFEILIPSCRDSLVCFDVYHNSQAYVAHNFIGSTHISLDQGRTQFIQHKLPLHTPTTSLARSTASTPCIFVSIVFRNVETVSWTRDSLQEAYVLRTHRQSFASCLDPTLKFLNPATNSLGSTASVPQGMNGVLNQGMNYEMSSSEEEEEGETSEIRSVEEERHRRDAGIIFNAPNIRDQSVRRRSVPTLNEFCIPTTVH